MRVYYEPCGGNFGDMFTKFLLENYYGVSVERATPDTAYLVGAGSILQNVPQDFGGVVIGTGVMFEHNKLSLSEASVLSVRGPLTASAIGRLGEVGYGDIGLLAYLFDEKPTKTTKVGVIPHYVDKRLGQHHLAGKVIDILGDPQDFINEVSSCETIITSSLHGLITADALGIPRTYAPHEEVLGDGFKFNDYSRSLGEGDLEPWVEHKPQRSTIEFLQDSIKYHIRSIV